MKKPAAVVAAEQFAARKAEEVAAAREALRQLEAARSSAYSEIRRAQEAADAHLPQCQMVTLNWRTGVEVHLKRAVILRKTPAGSLVVRGVGDAWGQEDRFKWQELGRKFILAKRRSTWARESLELRDVPDEYLPA